MYVSSVEIIGNIDFGDPHQPACVVAELVRYDRPNSAYANSAGTVAAMIAPPGEVYQVSAVPNRLPTLWAGAATLLGNRMMWSANGYQHHQVKLDGTRKVKVNGAFNAPRSNARLGLFVYTMAADGTGADLASAINCTFTILVRYRRKL